MTDLCEEEINSIESIFPGKYIPKKVKFPFKQCRRGHYLVTSWFLILYYCQVLLCDFHREQALERWTAKKDNGVSHSRETLLTLMRQIARQRQRKALKILYEITDWKGNQKLR